MNPHRGRPDERRHVGGNAPLDEILQVFPQRSPLDLVLDVALLVEAIGFHGLVEGAFRPSFSEYLQGDALANVAEGAAVFDQ